MYLRKCRKVVNGVTYSYWQLVESYRSERGPRQRVVANLGDMGHPARLGTAIAARGSQDVQQPGLTGDRVEPEWVEVDVSRVRVEQVRDYGAYWLGLELLGKLGLVEFLGTVMPLGREDVPWSLMATVLVLMRLVQPCSELEIAEGWFERSALGQLLGIPANKVNDDRLYRALDQVLPHKATLEKYLTNRLGQLFQLEYDLLLYDITSTYFEGQCAANQQARFGYSRDKRPDCKQVLIALVVSREGMPLGYEQLAGNRADVTTVEEMVEKIEKQYGKAGRIWVMDRGMVSEKNLDFLRKEGRRYIVGSHRGQLRQFREELASEEGWEEIAIGLRAKLVTPTGSEECFVLCRSDARGVKEKAMLARFEQRIEAGLQALTEACGKRRLGQGQVERRIGALLGRNSRARGLFKVQVGTREDGGATVEWQRRDEQSKWVQLQEGCYLLRTNVVGNAPELWRNYIQLTEVEAAFRIQKSDLRIRPIWHQKEERVAAHILVCFLAYVVWKTLGQMCVAAGLGNDPRKIIDELSGIKMVDVVLPIRSGVELRRRYISTPTASQAVLLDRLRLRLPGKESLLPL